MELETISEFEVRFSDLDANGHLKNTAYSEFATQSRWRILKSGGITPQKMRQWKIGPVFFREELVYRAEIHLFEKIKVESIVTNLSESGHKWSFTHLIYKENGTLAAQVNADGAWLDLEKRKVMGAPTELLEVLESIPVQRIGSAEVAS